MPVLRRPLARALEGAGRVRDLASTRAARPGATRDPDRTATLLAADGTRIAAAHDAHALGRTDLGIVVAHGFTGSWTRPTVRSVVSGLTSYGGVVSFDFRGHGRSSGVSTVGDLEVLDLDAAVAWARLLGYRRIATVGWSMGGSVVVRHAGLRAGTPQMVDAVVTVSSPARWYYRGTKAMRRVHLAVEHPVGRRYARWALRTRIGADGWDPVPESPTELAPRIAPTPLLVVHGDHDHFFPVEHAEALHAAAGEPKELWIVPGFAHAEAGATPELVARIGRWLVDTLGVR